MNSYDAILLDEAQDYDPIEIEAFARLGESLYAVPMRDKDIRGRGFVGYSEGEDFQCPRIAVSLSKRQEICRVADKLVNDSANFSL